MASRGNYYSELLIDEDVPEPTTLPAKKQEKKQKLNSALQDQKKSGKAKQAKQEQQPTHGFEPQVDATRPEKRVFDRHSGTGRGKEVAKQGHKGWGKEDDVKAIEEAKAEALEEHQPETAAPAEPAEEKPEPKKEERPEPEAPKEPPKPKNPPVMSLDQYYNKINSEKIRIEERGPRGTEIQQKEIPAEYKLLHDRTDKPRVQETIAIKPLKKPKQEQKKTEKPAPKQAEQKKDKQPAKEEKKQKNEPAQKGKKEEKKEPKKDQKKDQKKDAKKEEKKEKKPEPVPEPVSEPKKKEKRPEDMTTADFFKGAPTQPRRQPRGPVDTNIYHQVWRRENGKEVTEQIKVHQAEEESRPEQGRGRGRRFDSTAFPQLGKSAHKEQKPEHKEAQAAAPAAAPAPAQN